MKTQIHVPLEIVLPKEVRTDSVIFSSQNNSYTFPTFQKSNKKLYVRFVSEREGVFRYDVLGKRQTIDVTPYKGNNPLFLKGPIQVSKHKTLEHVDGTPFFYLSDTWWFGATSRMSDREFESLLKQRKKQGFSTIHIVVGIPPEVSAFDENAKNSGGFPFNKDWSLNTGYFDTVDKRIEKIVDAGLVPVIFGGWGHHIDWMGVEHVTRLWREIIARYASLPVIFSLSGEVDVFLTPAGLNPAVADTAKTKVKKLLERFPRPLFNLAVGAKRLGSLLLYQRYEKKLLRNRIEKWAQVGRYIHKALPLKRIVTAHPQRHITAFDLFGNPSWLTLNAIQSGHSRETVSFMKKAIMSGRKPIVNLEPWYEGIAENFDDYYQRVGFWTCMLSGAIGHGYGAHGVWQFSNKDNFMRHWGASDFRDAKEYKGADQIGTARNFLMDRQWFSFQPEPHAFSYASTKRLLFTPVVGKNSGVLLIYIPDQRFLHEITLHHSLSHKTITVIEPETMAKLKTMKMSGNKLMMPVDEDTRDILLLIE